MIRWVLLGLVLVNFGVGFSKAFQQPAPARFRAHPSSALPEQPGGLSHQHYDQAGIFESHFATSTQHIQTHAASLVELKNGFIRAFWFAGSREGAKDVQIRSATFDPTRSQWSAEQIVVTREATAKSLQRYVSKLGNPVAGRAADGTLWLYYVTVSIGGWSGSSITAMNSADEGETWGPPRRYVTSPFLNVSTLVKGAPFLYSDGTMGLPVYHEFIDKFGELLRFDRSGTLMDKQRLSAGRDHGLQPVLLAKSADEALVLMRYAGANAPHRVISVSTNDAGQHWSTPQKSALSNPDAALAAVVLPDGRILAALNNQESGREALSLVLSADGGATWITAYQLENQLATRHLPMEEARYEGIVEGLARETEAKAPYASGEYGGSVRRQMCREGSCRFEFSYPYLIQTRLGHFHLVYTWNRSFIKHVHFNLAWLDQRLQAAK